MRYDFDEIIDRSATNSLNYDGWKQYIFQAEASAEFPYKDEDYIRLWVADMEFSTAPEILDAIRERLDRKIFGYTRIYDRNYFDVLEAWFQKYYNWQIDCKEIVTSPGVVSALMRLVPLLTKEDESILITTPSYAPFKKAGDHSNRNVVYSNLLLDDGHYTMDFDDIHAKILDPELKIKTFILCHPHNPTGRVWTEGELLRLGKMCVENNVWIISDEIHSDLLRQGGRHIPLASLFPDSDRIITCTAPSKTFNLAGNMLSHIFIKNKEVRTLWTKYYDAYHSPLSLVATQAAYERGGDWLEALKKYLDENMLFLAEKLQELVPKAKFKIPEATYLAWIDLSDYASCISNMDNLSLFFAEKSGVLIEGGHMFVSNGFGHIRLNVACPRLVLKTGIERIASAINH